MGDGGINGKGWDTHRGGSIKKSGCISRIGCISRSRGGSINRIGCSHWIGCSHRIGCGRRSNGCIQVRWNMRRYINGTRCVPLMLRVTRTIDDILTLRRSRRVHGFTTPTLDSVASSHSMATVALSESAWCKAARRIFTTVTDTSNGTRTSNGRWSSLHIHPSTATPSPPQPPPQGVATAAASA